MGILCYQSNVKTKIVKIKGSTVGKEIRPFKDSTTKTVVFNSKFSVLPFYVERKMCDTPYLIKFTYIKLRHC